MLNCFGSIIIWLMSLFLTLYLLTSSPCCDVLPARECDLDEAVVFLCGVPELSEVPADVYEHFSKLRDRPLAVNLCSRAELAASSLFSSYQVETILDYRSRNGDILSVGELEIVDGFNPALCNVLAVFLDFTPASRAQRMRFLTNAEAGAGCKIAEGKLSLQYTAGAGFTAQMLVCSVSGSVHARTPWAAPAGELPEVVGWNVSYSSTGAGRARDFKSFMSECITSVTIGCFNAKFGQGLTQYSGLSFDNYSSPESLMRRSSGISPYNGYSPTYAMTGAAVSMLFALPRGSVSGHIFGAWSNGNFGGYLQWEHPSGSVGAGMLMPRGALWVDFQHSVKRSVLFGEAGLTARSPFGLGQSFRALIGAKTDFQNSSAGARASFNDGVFETAGSVNVMWDRRRQSFTAGGQYKAKNEKPFSAYTFAGMYRHSAKAMMSYSYSGRYNLTYTFKLSSRYTGASHVTTAFGASNSSLQGQVKAVIDWNTGTWSASINTDATACKSVGLLGGLKVGYCRGIWNLSAQGGLFRIDEWDDRIYIYRKDMPGLFGSSAMYGRGYWLNCFGSVQIWRCFRLYLYGDWTSYPWAREKDKHRRPSCALKIQLAYKF